MTDVIVDISMSLDGFVTGPDPDLDRGLGIGGEPLHHWAIDHKTVVDDAILTRTTERTGCVVMGRRLFDTIDGPHGWTDEMGYGAKRSQAAGPPVVVVTHEAPASIRLGARFTFATDGIVDAIDQARALAGEKDVVVMGGAGVIQSVLAADLADQLWVHLAPVLLGAGTRLFDHLPSTVTELEPLDTTITPHATHLRYRVGR